MAATAMTTTEPNTRSGISRPLPPPRCGGGGGGAGKPGGYPGGPGGGPGGCPGQAGPFMNAPGDVARGSHQISARWCRFSAGIHQLAIIVPVTRARPGAPRLGGDGPSAP
ncbi:hypothetical protein F7P10_13885 [Actinomadura sp. WMMB 499]|nr:hypothetical protein F7P10_13885 [Actinomadura sp. WMMB 499]